MPNLQFPRMKIKEIKITSDDTVKIELTINAFNSDDKFIGLFYYDAELYGKEKQTAFSDDIPEMVDALFTRLSVELQEKPAVVFN